MKINTQLDGLYTPNASKELVSKGGVFVLDSNNHYRVEQRCGQPKNGFIRIDHKRYYVKYCRVFSKYLFDELFATFLAKKLALNSVGYKLFIDDVNKCVGNIVPDFGEHTLLSKLYLTIQANEVITAGKIVGRIAANYPTEQGYILDKKKLEHDLCVLSCFDFLTTQKDRHSNNIALKIRDVNGKKIVMLAPIFDNEYVFDPQVNDDLQDYKLTPIEGKYGEAHREFMQTEPWAIRFFEKFKGLVEGDNFVKTIREFESVFGLGKLLSLANCQEEYYDHIDRVKQSIDNRLAFMQQKVTERQ